MRTDVCADICTDMFNDTKCLSRCTERVLQQLSTFLQTGQKMENIFNPRWRREGGGTRKHGFRGKFSDDEEEKGGCLEFWSTCFLNDWRRGWRRNLWILTHGISTYGS